MKHTLRFPEGFLWGAACASYQVEGGIDNCDWAEAARQGKVPVCGAACDHYNRYESDFDIAQKLGHNCHKISLEWSRIEPEEGKFNQNEAEHYKNVIKATRAKGLEPMVLIWHFTLPLWFSHDGGFENSKSAERFAKYAEFVAKEILDDDIKFFMTINEPLIWAGNGYWNACWPPFKKSHSLLRRVIKNMAKGHRVAYDKVKAVRPNIQISVAQNNMYFKAKGINPINYLKEAVSRHWWNRKFLNKIERELDFIGLNYYFYIPYGHTPDLPKTEMGWYIYPEGLYHVIKELGRYKKPVYVIENGIADSKDINRKDFIVNHLFQIHRAIQAGIDVRGYLHWSLLDNYEWVFGFERRFGLVEVNFTTQERHIRPSAYVYKNICETNTLEIEL